MHRKKKKNKKPQKNSSVNLFITIWKCGEIEWPKSWSFTAPFIVSFVLWNVHLKQRSSNKVQKKKVNSKTISSSDTENMNNIILSKLIKGLFCISKYILYILCLYSVNEMLHYQSHWGKVINKKNKKNKISKESNVKRLPTGLIMIYGNSGNFNLCRSMTKKQTWQIFFFSSIECKGWQFTLFVEDATTWC